MASYSLPSATRLGALQLDAADPGRLADFYAGLIGMEMLSRGEDLVCLGAGGRELLRLRRKPGARHCPAAAGLYHFCLALPQRRDFGRLLRRLLEARVPLQGLVDHHAAEAIYLADPEGNGLELNWDRPREHWAGMVEKFARLGNLPLDVEGLLGLAGPASAEPWRLPADAWLGHVHLHVPDMQAARDFYRGRLGFDVMGEVGSQVCFVSAGGYHHHVAFNIWQGRGASAPPPDASGLDWFGLVLPSPADLEALLLRLRSGVPAPERAGEAWLLRDPAGHGLRLSCIA